jgi:single-strand DNA-binding protein
MNREHVSRADIVGNLGQKPEKGTLEDGTPFMRFTIATSERFTDSAGAIRERTEWHRATAWGPVAEQLAAKDFEQGDSVAVSGNVHIRSYTANGVQHRISEIEVSQADKNLDRAPSRNDSRLVGVVREEPKTKRLESGVTLTTLSLATKTMVNGKEREDWHSITAWGKTGEAAARDITAGDVVSINGPQRTRAVPGENGVERKLSAVEVSKFQVLERAQDRTKDRSPVPALDAGDAKKGDLRQDAVKQLPDPAPPALAKPKRARGKGVSL